MRVIEMVYHLCGSIMESNRCVEEGRFVPTIYQCLSCGDTFPADSMDINRTLVTADDMREFVMQAPPEELA